MADKKIRPISLAFIKNDNKLFVFEAEDKLKNETFFRPLGGGIEFGETSKEALIREFKEEINAEIKAVKLLEVFENIFKYEKQAMHEIIFLYEAEFIDKSWYLKDNIEIKARHEGRRAAWVEIDKLKESIIYPRGINKLL